MNDITQELPDEAATLALGARLALVIQPGLAIFLYGDLGAGKTTLVRGVLRGLGMEGKVKSPTYTLVEPYVISGLNLYHFDLYRLNYSEEWEAAGFREYFNSASICFIEWPEKTGELMPEPDIVIRLAHQDGGRIVSINANSNQGEMCLEGF